MILVHGIKEDNMKIAIAYYSKHHGNTKKLLDAIPSDKDIYLIDVTTVDNADLKDYDLIGFASGIYYGKFHKDILKFAKDNLPENKEVFFTYTCGKDSEKYIKEITDIANEKKSDIKGCYSCIGLDSFGPFKLIGGIRKGHPNEEEIQDFIDFFERISK